MGFDLARVVGGQLHDAPSHARARGQRWTWTGVRPQAVCGYAAGNPVNLATVLAIYGSIVRELGQPFAFPSTEACFNALIQVVDAELLARGAMFVSTTPGCGNRAYNVGNGDMFRWKHMWPALARYFGLEAAGPQAYSLKEFLSDKQPLWNDMTRKYGLKPFPFERTPEWAQGAFSPPNSRLGCEYDFISDTIRVRQAGFAEFLARRVERLRDAVAENHDALAGRERDDAFAERHARQQAHDRSAVLEPHHPLGADQQTRRGKIDGHGVPPSGSSLFHVGRWSSSLPP